MWGGVGCGALAGAMWGMVFIMPELLPAFTPLEMAVGRYLCYGGFALGLMLSRLGILLARLTRSDHLALLRHTLAGNIVYYMLLALGVKLAGVAPTSLVIGMLPISVTLLGSRDHGALPLRQLAWPLLVAGAGIACINIDLLQQASSNGGIWPRVLGVLCATGALLCWTWYTLDNTRYLKRSPHFSSAEWSALYGLASGLIALVIGLGAYACWHYGVAGVDGVDGAVSQASSQASGRDWTTFWLANALLALGASVIGNYLWNIACRRVPVTLSGQLILFETLFALLYGFIHQHQWPRPLEWAAMTLLAAGVLWSARLHAMDQPVTPG